MVEIHEVLELPFDRLQLFGTLACGPSMCHNGAHPGQVTEQCESALFDNSGEW